MIGAVTWLIGFGLGFVIVVWDVGMWWTLRELRVSAMAHESIIRDILRDCPQCAALNAARVTAYLERRLIEGA